MHSSPRVAIVNYSGYIVGDDAMFESLVSMLERIHGTDVGIDALTAVPEQTLSRYPVRRATHLYEFNASADTRRRAVDIAANADLMLIGGGDIIEGQTSLTNLTLMARMFGTPVGYVGVGVLEPEDNRSRRRLRQTARHVQFIVTRDAASAEMLRHMGTDRPREILVLPDLAVGLPWRSASAGEVRAMVLAREGISLSRRFVAVNLRSPETEQYTATWGADQYAALAGVCRALIDEDDVDIVGIPLVRSATDPFHGAYGEADDDVLTAFAALVNRPGRVHVLCDEYRPAEVARILSEADLAIGMRLHFLVLAACAGVPPVALSYARKVRAFMASVGLERLCLDASAVDSAALSAAVGTARAEQEYLRAALADWRREAAGQLVWIEKLVAHWTARPTPLRRLRRLCLLPVAFALLTLIHAAGELRRRIRRAAPARLVGRRNEFSAAEGDGTGAEAPSDAA